MWKMHFPAGGTMWRKMRKIRQKPTTAISSVGFASTILYFEESLF